MDTPSFFVSGSLLYSLGNPSFPWSLLRRTLENMPSVAARGFLNQRLAHKKLVARDFFFLCESSQSFFLQIGELLPMEFSQKLWVSYVFRCMG